MSSRFMAQVAEQASADMSEACDGVAQTISRKLIGETADREESSLSNTLETEAETTQKFQSILDDSHGTAAETSTVGGVPGGKASGEAGATGHRIRDIGNKAGSGEEGGGGLVLKRQDDDFSSDTARGVRKSHIDSESGDLVPANPDGETTVLQHVEGNRNRVAKGNSPYTSFAPEDGTGKVYGAEEIRLDHERLQADIASGKVTGVQVLGPEEIQSSIQAKIDETAGTHVELPEGQLKNDQIQQIAKDQGLSKSKTKELVTRITALSNTRRDSEWLVKGVVPKEYLIGPFRTG